MIWATQEFAFVELADRHARASVIMPHKKNPYSLAYLRGVAGVEIGRLAAMANVGRTPSAQVDNRIFAYGRGPARPRHGDRRRSADGRRDAGPHLRLELMARRALDGHGQATDLAEVIMIEGGLNYRDAHRVVGSVVRQAVERGQPLREVDSDLIDQVSRAVLGRPLVLAPDVVAQAVDPAAIVASRAGAGGAAREPMLDMIAECRAGARAADEWRTATAAILTAAEEDLVKQATALAADHAGPGARPQTRRRASHDHEGFLDAAPRSQKPRETGISLVLDKGTGLREIEDLLASASDYIDIVKLGWGTGYVTQNLRDKVNLYQQAGIPVYLGGTLLELSILQNRFDEYREMAQSLGLTHVELSTGIIELSIEGQGRTISASSRRTSRSCPRWAARARRRCCRPTAGSSVSRPSWTRAPGR